MKNLHDIPREKLPDSRQDFYDRFITTGMSNTINHAVNYLHGRDGVLYIDDPVQDGPIRVGTTTGWTLTYRYDET